MITYIDTYNNNGQTYSDYLEYCKENDLQPAPENSDIYFYWLNETTGFYTDDFFTNLEYTRFNDEIITIMGSCGTWRGRRDIQPVKCNGLTEAIKKCWGSCDDLKVTLNKGVLEVAALHHDGTNYFKLIRPRGHFWPAYLY